MTEFQEQLGNFGSHNSLAAHKEQKGISLMTGMIEQMAHGFQIGTARSLLSVFHQLICYPS